MAALAVAGVLNFGQSTPRDAWTAKWLPPGLQRYLTPASAA